MMIVLLASGCWSSTPLSKYKGSGGASGTSTGSGSETAVSSGSTSPVAPGGFFTQGNRIYNSEGKPQLLRGVARPSLEWNYNGENLSSDDYQLMTDWGANVVRIALNQGFWLSGSVAHHSGYAARIDQQIEWATAAGLAVILDLHWSDRGDLNNWPEQQRMADANSLRFWKEGAARYAHDGRVLFELYNEPHDISWQVWRNGGPSGDGFDAVGMQALYDAVRSTGAHNVVIIGGTHWAYYLDEVPAHRVDGYNIVYATHLYGFADKQPASWQKDWLALAATDPLMVTEFGGHDSCSADYTQQVVDVALANELSFTAWAWYPGGCNFPSLIQDWSGTPTADGSVVKQALAK